jgi:hypothetical protein
LGDGGPSEEEKTHAKRVLGSLAGWESRLEVRRNEIRALGVLWQCVRAKEEMEIEQNNRSERRRAGQKGKETDSYSWYKSTSRVAMSKLEPNQLQRDLHN